MHRGYPDRHLIVIFGATGDLSHRKLIPALWEIERHSNAKGRATILGVARAGITDAQFREQVIDAMKKAGETGPEIADWAHRSIFLQTLGDSGPSAYQGLRGRIEELE